MALLPCPARQQLDVAEQGRCWHRPRIRPAVSERRHRNRHLRVISGGGVTRRCAITAQIRPRRKRGCDPCCDPSTPWRWECGTRVEAVDLPSFPGAGTGSFRLPEKLALRGLDHRDDGGMQQPALGRDGVKLLGHRLDAPDRFDPILPNHVVGNCGGCHEQTGASLTESLEQGAVLEFAHDARI